MRSLQLSRQPLSLMITYNSCNSPWWITPFSNRPCPMITACSSSLASLDILNHVTKSLCWEDENIIYYHSCARVCVFVSAKECYLQWLYYIKYVHMCFIYVRISINTCMYTARTHIHTSAHTHILYLPVKQLEWVLSFNLWSLIKDLASLFIEL